MHLCFFFVRVTSDYVSYSIKEKRSLEDGMSKDSVTVFSTYSFCHFYVEVANTSLAKLYESVRRILF